MKERFGQLRAELAESDSEQLTVELVRLINENIKPLEPVTPEDVCIRSMYIVSDQVNSYGGRFPVAEHDRLSGLLVDSPVMVGHRKDALPIGRNFHAATVERNGRPWVRSYFYWPKSAAGAESLRENIDRGVYKECSIGFTYLMPECSICGGDLRRCSHNLFQEYSVGGEAQVCHFNYRQIERVLETSLVYRGATPDTAISNELSTADGVSLKEGCELDSPLSILSDLSSLNSESKYLVIPHYEGIDVMVSCGKGDLRIHSLSGQERAVRNVSRFRFSGDFDRARGKLVGYRGKERCAIEHLRQYLELGKPPVTRAMLYLYPDAKIAGSGAMSANSAVRFFHHRFVRGSELLGCAEALKTKSGVEIWQLTADSELAGGVRFVPDAATKPALDDSFSVGLKDGSPNGYLRIKQGTGESRMVIHTLNLSRLKRGTRFLADLDKTDLHGSFQTIISGKSVVRTASGGFRLTIEGQSTELLWVQPIRLDGQSRFLAYLSSGVR